MKQYFFIHTVLLHFLVKYRHPYLPNTGQWSRYSMTICHMLKEKKGLTFCNRNIDLWITSQAEQLALSLFIFSATDDLIIWGTNVCYRKLHLIGSSDTCHSLRAQPQMAFAPCLPNIRIIMTSLEWDFHMFQLFSLLLLVLIFYFFFSGNKSLKFKGYYRCFCHK